MLDVLGFAQLLITHQFASKIHAKRALADDKVF